MKNWIGKRNRKILIPMMASGCFTEFHLKFCFFHLNRTHISKQRRHQLSWSRQMTLVFWTQDTAVTHATPDWAKRAVIIFLRYGFSQAALVVDAAPFFVTVQTGTVWHPRSFFRRGTQTSPWLTLVKCAVASPEGLPLRNNRYKAVVMPLMFCLASPSYLHGRQIESYCIGKIFREGEKKLFLSSDQNH
jgi:hypothetical protein